MKRTIAGFLLFILMSSCSFHLPELPTWPRTNGFLEFIQLKKIGNPDSAEVAVYVGAKIFEAAVSVVNRAHKAHLKPFDDEIYYANIVGSSTSLAVRTQIALRTADEAVQIWRATGDRKRFDRDYTVFGMALDALTKEAR